MQVTATLINLYHVCHRELWLHHNGIRMEHTSDLVYEGKLIGETTYEERAEKNTQLELAYPLGKDWEAVVKIDFYDPKTKTVHETKKSDKMEGAHVAQVKFYLYILLKNGVEGATGIIEYPKLRERRRVEALEEADVAEIEAWLRDVRGILEREDCPAVLNKPLCRQCSYYEFCYAD